MQVIGRRLLASVVPAILVVAALLIPIVTAQPAGAYGSAAQWQVGLSGNCNNPTVRGADQLGGFWGWVEFDNDNTMDAELAYCNHLLRGSGAQPPFGGALHTSVDVPASDGWFIASSSGNPAFNDFWINGEVDTFTGHGKPVTMVDPDPPYPSDTGIPAMVGHFSTDEVLGFHAPGVSYQVQVVKIPGR
jgi:hypothetical protein